VETLVHSPAQAPGLPASPERRALLAVICGRSPLWEKITEVLFFAEVLRAYETLFFRQEKSFQDHSMPAALPAVIRSWMPGRAARVGTVRGRRRQ
jgi:hypothetical protein